MLTVCADLLYLLFSDNYQHASDTIFGGWKESDMRAWLVEHGYIKSDAQIQRDKLLNLMNAKYANAFVNADVAHCIYINLDITKSAVVLLRILPGPMLVFAHI